jgi:hypothetical protein
MNGNVTGTEKLLLDQRQNRKAAYQETVWLIQGMTVEERADLLTLMAGAALATGNTEAPAGELFRDCLDMQQAMRVFREAGGGAA